MTPFEVATSKTTFVLGDAMEAPTVSVLEPVSLSGPVALTVKSKKDHDVTYELALNSEISKGQRLKLKFEYSNIAAKGFVFLLSKKECLAGGYNTCWFPSVGESRRMVGSLAFETPSGYLVKASGRQIDAKENGGVRSSQFRLEQPIVPTFAAANFFVKHVEGAVPMTVYMLTNRPIANTYAEGCSKILSVLKNEYGPYPFPDFSIIETPSPESSRDCGFSGASFEGFMFADSASINSGFNLAYFGHEIGHQWWGNLVQMSGDKGSYMLSEAMAQYGSLQCVDKIEGPAMAAKYRFSGYPGYSSRQCAHGALMYGPTGEDRPMSSMPPGYDPVYHLLANSKGFLIWDTIASQIGRDRFKRALRRVTSQFAWESLTFDQFLDALRKEAGRDIDPILSQWLDRTGAPILISDWRQSDSKLNVSIHQSSPTYILHLPILIEFVAGSKATKWVDLDTESKAFRFHETRPVKVVTIDPEWEVFHSTPEIEAEAVAQKSKTQELFARMRK